LSQKLKWQRKKQKNRGSLFFKGVSGELVRQRFDLARKEDRGYETSMVLLESIKRNRIKLGKTTNLTPF